MANDVKVEETQLTPKKALQQASTTTKELLSKKIDSTHEIEELKNTVALAKKVRDRALLQVKNENK